MEDWYFYLLVVLVGVFAGFMNTMAGGGSLLSLPLLMFLGLPANVANGTNRIAILLQNVVGASSYKKQKVLDLKTGFILGIPAIIGSLIGAVIAVDIDEDIMNKVIGGILVFMIVLIVLKPKKWLKGDDELQTKPMYLKFIIFFFIGVYGGFIQAGVGFFLLAGLVLGAGYNLVEANALKVFIVLLYTPIALLVFMYSKQVDYVIGLTLALGNMIGAYIAAKLSIEKGAGFIRVVLIFSLVIMSLKLLGVFSLFF